MNSTRESFLSGDELNKTRSIVMKSRNGAKEYSWLFQCTSFENLINIIKSHELWLSNLKDLNDKEEPKRINRSEFENSYFVSCFTYDSNIGKDHWEEYGINENGILYGLKKEWVKKEAEFILDNGENFSSEDHFKIYLDSEEANKKTIEEFKLNHRECYPYYFFDFGFYKIIYDDYLKINMDCPCSWTLDSIKLENGKFISTDSPGIIKKTQGECQRKGNKSYKKNWEEEKEIRLKVGVMSDHGLLPSDLHFSKLAVKLCDNAFDDLIIKFSPYMPECIRNEIVIKLKSLLPKSQIQIIE